ncbi:hypothetical protein LSUB1_G004779 [Lachnellula subtilissima]|uniref:Glutathione S-transferase n=1 Tax=Lachnellula subtilissima TaxID=602034 RepID=A0A8H8RJI9_9HELO|nr:hypothetical protein LSUB1_G004779 [Lachnellula subtilissima]
MADNKPTLHHMNCSQSQRILWLLEELNIEYNLISHERNPPNHPTHPYHAPTSLVAAGHYGKSPLLITGAKDGSRPIPESSAIATYLIRSFDTEDKFGLKNGDWIRDEILSSIDSTTFNHVHMQALMFDWGVLKAGDSAGNFPLSGKAYWTVLADLEYELKNGPKGGYFMGEHPGRADILLEFQMSMVKLRNWADLKADYPLLDAWLERVYARDAWKRGLAKGNGYDLSMFPKIPERR